MHTNYSKEQLADEALAAMLPGFESYNTEVNGISLHYVAGGSGQPLILLPGWPETWWAYHKIMPALAGSYRVIALDLRGMGSSGKPATGYDKKNMAADIAALVTQLALGRVHIAGHDIGATVAFSFAALYPELTATLTLLDTPPLDENIYRLPMLPVPGAATAAAGEYVYPWWLAFNQVTGLPELLLEGRMHLLIDYIFSYVGVQNSKVSAFDKAVYAAAYAGQDAIRAGNAWYQAFPQDVTDRKLYGKLQVPVLGIGSSGFGMLQQAVQGISDNCELVAVPGGGHFFFEEEPELTVHALIRFLEQHKAGLR